MTTALLKQVCAALDDAREMKTDFTPEKVRELWPELAKAASRPTLFSGLLAPKVDPPAKQCPLELLLAEMRELADLGEVNGMTCPAIVSRDTLRARVDEALARYRELDAADLLVETSEPVVRMLEQLLATGLWGTTVDEVAERLICERLVQLDGDKWVDAKAVAE